MQSAQARAPGAGWRTKGAATAGKPSGSAAAAGKPPRAAVQAQATGAASVSAVAGALDAIKRSPLGLELPSDHPGLAALAKSLLLTRI